mgnify:CR=1 FL=1
MNRARIIGVGAFAPKRILTNRELEKMVDTTNEWILQRTGIRERHIVEPGVGTSDIAEPAAKRHRPTGALVEFRVLVAGRGAVRVGVGGGFRNDRERRPSRATTCGVRF